MSGPLFGRGAVSSNSGRRRRTAVALLLAISLHLTGRAVAQTRDAIPPPPNWDPDQHVLYAFTPNDPYYFTGSPSGFPGQWHLNVQSSGAVYDAKLSGAWNRDATGQGVVIGIANSRHLAQAPFHIHQLVAATVHQSMLDRAAELMESPDSPNLFWALTALPARAYGKRLQP